MSSLWKDDRTTNHVACFTIVDGNRLVQLKRSTGTSDRELAKEIAIKLEQVGRGLLATEGVKSFLQSIKDLRTQRLVRRAFDDVMRRTTGRGLGNKTARGFVQSWLERTRNEVSPATWAKYQKTTELFLDALGGKADEDLNSITKTDIVHFRDEQVKRVAPATANGALKIIRVVLGAAEADGVVTRNEAKHVKILRARRDRTLRRAFTLPELKRILTACSDEWRSLVLFGFYTGARLGDLATLTWQNVDLSSNELRYTTRKTGRRVVIPLAEPLRAYIETLPAGDDPQQPLHPRAQEISTSEGRVGTLSRQFGEILAAAGLIKPRSHHADELKRKGRSARRELTELSFHCLRHTAVSLLKNAGVSDAVAQDLVGHESADVSRLYTHIDDAAKRAAVNKLPSL
jgi:integrase